MYSDFSLASYAFCLFQNRGHQGEISSESKTVQSVGLKHGDLLYLEPLNGAVIFDQSTESSSPEESVPSTSRGPAVNSSNGFTHSSMNIVFPNNQIVEDEVDQQLWKSDGKVRRKRDPKL